MPKLFANWLIARAQKAVEASPDDASLWPKLYGLFLENQNAPGFVAFCADFIRRNPTHQIAWKNWRMAGEDPRAGVDAPAFIRDLVRAHPDNEYVWTQFDLEIEKSGVPGGLVGFCREIVAQQPQAGPAWTRLLRALKQEAKHADVVIACQQALQYRPDAQTWVTLAEAYAAQRKFDEAIPAFEKALAIKGDYLVALNGLGCVYQTQGRHTEAIAVYQRATQLRKDDATPWVWLALAYMQTGDAKQAAAAIEKVKPALPQVAAMLSEQLAALLPGQS